MTRRERRIYWKRERNKAVRYIAKYRTKFYNALQSDVRGFEQAFKEGGVQQARTFTNNLIVSPKVTSVLQEVIREVGVAYARQNYNSLRKEKAFGKSLIWLQKIMEYLGLNFYDKGVFQIVKTSRKLFTDILNMAIDGGWGYFELSRYISDNVPRINRNRAELIARTEVGRAIHAGTYVGADESPFEKQKEWISALDDRTRGNPINGLNDKADHWNLDGQVVDFNAKFIDRSNRVEMNHPHDPEAPANEVIQCRCTYAVTNKRDSNGRLIRKVNF